MIWFPCGVCREANRLTGHAGGEGLGEVCCRLGPAAQEHPGELPGWEGLCGGSEPRLVGGEVVKHQTLSVTRRSGAGQWGPAPSELL